MEAVPGYLSLHQSAESLTLKWTPNQLMNGTLGDSELEKRWGLWDSPQEPRKGVRACQQAGGWRGPACSKRQAHTLPDAKNCRERLPGDIPKLSKIQPVLDIKGFS